MLSDPTTFRVILATSCVASLVISFVVARYGPRGAVLFMSTALMAVGLTPMFEPWGNLAPAGVILRTVGFLGMACGIVDLFRRLLIIQAATAESPDAGDTAAAANDQRPRTRPTPGLWAALAWCTVLATGLELLPNYSADVIAATDFRSVVRGFDADGFLHTAIRTDLGAARGSVRHGLFVTLGMAVASAVAMFLVCLLLNADVGPHWRRMVGLAWPRPLQVLAAVVGGTGLWILFAGLDTVLTRTLLISMNYTGTREYAPALPQLPLAVALIFGAVIPAIVHEFWFRAYIGRGLTGRLGPVLGVLVTSCLCALTRLDMRVVILGFALGIVLHLAYLASGSLPATILIHGCVAVGDIVMARSAYPFTDSIATLGYVAAIIFVLTAGVLLYRNRVPHPSAAPGG